MTWSRWAPWILGAIAGVAFGALGPRAAVAADAPAWALLARVASHPQIVAAVLTGAAAALAARLVTGLGGGDAAAIAGAVAAAAVVAIAGPWAHGAAAGPAGLGAALVLGGLALAERVAGAGGGVVGLGAAVVLGLAAAVDPAALAVAPVVLALFAVRLYHGARWPIAAPAAGAFAYVVARLPVWLGAAGSAPRPVPHVRYAIAIADAIGAIAVVAAAAGVLALLGRRSSRWAGAFLVAGVAGGAALDRLAGHGVGAVPIAALAVATGAGVARLARLAGPPIGQACLGGAAALIVAVPVALAAS